MNRDLRDLAVAVVVLGTFIGGYFFAQYSARQNMGVVTASADMPGAAPAGAPSLPTVVATDPGTDARPAAKTPPAATATAPAPAAKAALPALPTSIRIDGSSTVFLITKAMGDEFMKVNPNVTVRVGEPPVGSGGGFKKFTVGELDISDASRPIKAKEDETARLNGVDYVEIPVAFDGISVIVNPKNTWCNEITMAELKRIWEPDSKVKTWKDVRPDWPDRPIKLFGLGVDSGTFEFFNEAVTGDGRKARRDVTASQDPENLIPGIAEDVDAMGYFGFGYYVEAKNRLKAVAIDNGKGPVMPSFETILNGTYAPLSRPIFIYPSVKALGRAEVEQFVGFYLAHAPEIVKKAGYVPLPDKFYDIGRKRLTGRITGSAFNKDNHGQPLERIYGGS